MSGAVAIGAPQLIYLALTVLGLGYVIAKHGERRPPYSMWASFISLAIVYPLLWWGGFFTH
ncbi:hypothetical protein [Mesorhizobium sp. LSHC414A00]|uniref:hypothetical protein n=1 Tax=Mesorhizobium sp. LSHC414A00 TaxID=1287287 RepID=UPI0003CEE826|nr:hypothetical protein [Mesorhizobium sp. LSHC414A00]ESX78494.1 hypothetical protein X757_09150 [Mesorhizobium sp. LSHC414A00]